MIVLWEQFQSMFSFDQKYMWIVGCWFDNKNVLCQNTMWHVSCQLKNTSNPKNMFLNSPKSIRGIRRVFVTKTVIQAISALYI